MYVIMITFLQDMIVLTLNNLSENMVKTTVSTSTDVWYTHMSHGTYLKWHRMKMDSAIERKDKV